MSEEKQAHIVCAVRGGRRSQPAVKEAVEMARERQARLTFLYVVDLNFMKYTMMGRTELISEELIKMGEFMMIRICEQAEAEGCESSDFVIRRGKIRDEIEAYLSETQPDLLILGRPHTESEEPTAFEFDAIVHFAEEVMRKTGVKVKLV